MPHLETTALENVDVAGDVKKWASGYGMERI